MCRQVVTVDKQLSDFLKNEQEISAISELQEELHSYILQKVALGGSESVRILLSIQDYLSLTRTSHTERSNVLYLNVMDAKSDSKDTLMTMLQELHLEFIKKQRREHLVVERDAKLYELLQSLKYEYGDELEWVIPYPGDWHMLMNYQAALMKPYFDAGLKALAEACGYPVAAIQSTSHFKRTHYFIIESWEAMYRAMLETFLQISVTCNCTCPSTCTCQCTFTSPKELLENVTRILIEADTDCEQTFRTRFNVAIAKISDISVQMYSQFKQFIQTMDDTWRFWVQYVFVDAMAYISLFLAI